MFHNGTQGNRGTRRVSIFTVSAQTAAECGLTSGNNFTNGSMR